MNGHRFGVGRQWIWSRSFSYGFAPARCAAVRRRVARLGRATRRPSQGGTGTAPTTRPFDSLPTGIQKPLFGNENGTNPARTGHCPASANGYRKPWTEATTRMRRQTKKRPAPQTDQPEKRGTTNSNALAKANRPPTGQALAPLEKSGFLCARVDAKCRSRLEVNICYK